MDLLQTNKKLVIAGGANYKSGYIKSIMNTNDERIIFLGPVYAEGHIKELHCNCFAYIHGNEVGGTNPALLKAMGYGNMVLASDNVFNNEVLFDAGISYKKDPSDLATKLQKIIDNPGIREEYKHKAVNRIKQCYTWEKITNDYIKLFKSLL